MSQRIPGSYALAPGDTPPKRKRGRPRKASAQAQNTPSVPAPEGPKASKPSGSSGVEADGVLGQVVTGVIDGSFDAGYLLNVKVGDTDTQLRGVVFLPGRFAPITAENDVAPFAKMCKRRAVPFPNIKRQSQPSGFASPDQSDKQPVEPKDQVPNPQSGISEATEKQYPAVMIPLVDDVPKTDRSLQLSGKVMPPQMEEPKVDEPGEAVQENAASKMMKGPNEVEANEESKTEPEPELDVSTLLGVEASKLMKGPNEVGANEESKAEPESEPAADLSTSTLVKGPTDVEANEESEEGSAPLPVADISQGVEVVDKQPEIHAQALSSEPPRNDSSHDEVKTLNLELNQAPVVSDPKFDINISMEKQDNAEGVLQEKQSEHAVEVPVGEGKPLGDATNITGEGSLTAVKHTQGEMMSEDEASPTESKPASEGRVSAGPTEPEIRSPSGAVTSMECDEKDAKTPPSES